MTKQDMPQTMRSVSRVQIESFTITCFSYPRDRVIGDSQVRSDWQHIGALELHASNGRTGLGFFQSLFVPLPALVELERLFRETAVSDLIGQNPFTLVNRVTRPRGGNQQINIFAEAINLALWDINAQTVGLPLYQLLGGQRQRVRAYASPLAFHLSDEEFCALLKRGQTMGFTAYKIKVGHPDLAWDVARLQLARDTVGPEVILMADANEAWSPKEAIRRLHAYRDAGITLYWIEDPCLRDDFIGLREIRQAVPFTHINSGEYLNLRGKRQLITQEGVDILNIHGHISDGLRAGWLAAEYGLPVSLGNTMLEVGIHLAASLPEANWIEYSFLNYNQLVEEPIQFVDGFAIAPDRLGHGLVLSEKARRELSSSKKN